MSYLHLMPEEVTVLAQSEPKYEPGERLELTLPDGQIVTLEILACFQLFAGWVYQVRADDVDGACVVGPIPEFTLDSFISARLGNTNHWPALLLAPDEWQDYLPTEDVGSQK